MSLAIAPGSGSNVVAIGETRVIRFWDIESEEFVGQPWKGHTAAIKALSFSPDGSKLVSGSADTSVRIWDVTSARYTERGPTPWKERANRSDLHPPTLLLLLLLPHHHPLLHARQGWLEPLHEPRRESA